VLEEIILTEQEFKLFDLAIILINSLACDEHTR
jgi:hypothetical protein